MIFGPILSLSLLLPISVEPGIPSSTARPTTGMSAQQKSQIMQPLVRSATECIVRTVVADLRAHASDKTTDMREIIVLSMPSCADAMRAMINAYNQLYGDGSGETFFTGPYLDMLPATVMKSVQDGLE